MKKNSRYFFNPYKLFCIKIPQRKFSAVFHTLLKADETIKANKKTSIDANSISDIEKVFPSRKRFYGPFVLKAFPARCVKDLLRTDKVFFLCLYGTWQLYKFIFNFQHIYE